MSINYKSIGRNDPCPCGSGKKYKQCCQNKDVSGSDAAKNRLLESVPELFKKALKLQQINELEQAENLYKQILDINPKHVDTLNKLGLIYLKTDRRDLSKNAFYTVVKLLPSSIHYNNLAQVLPDNEAIECLHQAIMLNPGDPILYNSLGAIFSRTHRTTEAMLCYKKAININPSYTPALNNLATTFMEHNQHKKAAEYYRAITEFTPNDETPYKSLLFCLCFDEDAFPNLYLEKAKLLDRLWQKVSEPYEDWQVLQNVDSNQTLRIGLVSGDIGNHPVGYFLEGVINHINKTKIEFYVYSTRYAPNEDEISQRIKNHCKEWYNIRALTNEQAAKKIHNDNIHILVDLAGYTANTGLSVFVWKPAPIQVSWLGYFASTGLQCIDYFIADPVSVPNENKHFFSEKLWYLPQTRLCFTPPTPDIFQKIAPPPVINNNFITFGCFQQFSKLNDATLQNWCAILKGCNGSKIKIKNKQLSDESIKQAFLARLQGLGFDTDCVILEGGSPRSEYLQSYNSVDIMLDTFPYPGGTTTCEALWMGVPTLTLAGNTLLSRQGMSMLHCVGLNDWVTHNQHDYINRAIAHANNINRLQQLRSTLRETMQKSPLANAHLFSKNLESAFMSIWKERIAS